MSYFVELDPSEINDILSDGKLHGVYAQALSEFRDSKLQNAVISLKDGVFKGKTAATVRQSFLQNAEKMEMKITVAAREKAGVVILSKA